MTRLNKLPISPSLLWEYDLATFDFDRSRRVVIERIIARGSMEEWRVMKQFYGVESVLDIVSSSKQLSKRDREFASFFIYSGFLNVA